MEMIMLGVFGVTLDLPKTCILSCLYIRSSVERHTLDVICCALRWHDICSCWKGLRIQLFFFPTCSLEGSTDCWTTEQVVSRAWKVGSRHWTPYRRVCVGLKKSGSGELCGLLRLRACGKCGCEVWKRELQRKAESVCYSVSGALESSSICEQRRLWSPDVYEWDGYMLHFSGGFGVRRGESAESCDWEKLACEAV